jgi:hypothetical protein
MAQAPNDRDAVLLDPRQRYPNVFDATRHREWTRIAITGGIIAVYLVLVLFLVWHTATALWDENGQKQLSFIATTFLAPLGGLAGPIIGFYFAEQRGR